MKIFSLVCIVLSLSLLSSCYYDSEEELYGTTNCDTSDVTFSGTIKPILDANCQSCHNATTAESGVITDTYSDLIPHVNSGIFWKAVNHDSTVVPMPYKLPKLQDCELKKIKAWINQGAKDN